MTSIVKAGLAAIVVVAAVQVPADVALARKAKPEVQHLAATTDIRDCAKLSVDKRDRCISLSRPISGAAIYAKKMTIAQRAAASVAKIGAVATAVVAGAKLALAKDGTTDIRSCARLAAAKRDTCISRSRPVMGAMPIAKAKVDPAAEAKEAAAKAKDAVLKAKQAAAAKGAAAATTAAAAVPAVKSLKGLMAKDGTTDIKDCGKVEVALRDKCISASRPVKGVGLLAGVSKATINDAGLEAAAKSAALRAVTAVRNVFAKDGTTNIKDCSKVETSLRDKCISASRPVTGSQLMQRS